MYDVVIVGAGPAGISAGLYIKRANLNVLILYKDKSALEKTENIQNYYGFQNGISGKELYISGINQAKNLNIDVKKEEVINIKITENSNYMIETENENYYSKSVIIAFEGKGVSYCAICDGFFYRNKDVAILGNGKYALSELNDLKNIAKSITILTDGKEVPKIDENIKIDNRKILRLLGNERLEEIEFEDNTKIKIDGMFIALGVAGGSEFAKKLGILTKNNKIIVNENMETNISGIFACGDCVGRITSNI